MCSFVFFVSFFSPSFSIFSYLSVAERRASRKTRAAIAGQRRGEAGRGAATAAVAQQQCRERAPSHRRRLPLRSRLRRRAARAGEMHLRAGGDLLRTLALSSRLRSLVWREASSRTRWKSFRTSCFRVFFSNRERRSERCGTCTSSKDFLSSFFSCFVFLLHSSKQKHHVWRRPQDRESRRQVALGQARRTLKGESERAREIDGGGERTRREGLASAAAANDTPFFFFFYFSLALAHLFLSTVSARACRELRGSTKREWR